MSLPVIDRDYFKGISVIPNVEQSYIDVDGAVTTFSEAFYIEVFGYDFYKRLVANYNPGVTTSVYYKVINGTEFTVDGIVYKWDGLFNTKRESPLADYIWMHYIKEVWNNTTVGGVLQIVPTDSKQDFKGLRIIDVCDRMEKAIEMLYNYIYYATDTEFDSIKTANYPYKKQSLNWMGI